MLWYHYRMLAPARELYHDDDTRILARVPVQSDVGVQEVAVVGGEDGPESIRVKLEHPTGHFPAPQSRTMMQLTGHMLTCMRLVDNCEANFASYNGQFLAILAEADPQGRPSLKIELKHLLGERPPYPRTDLENTFSVTWPHSALFDLVANSRLSSVPLQYQFLSLFKVLEHEFRVAGKWENRLREFLLPHETEFQLISGSNQSLHNEVQDLRDKAAHMKIGKTDTIGFAGLGSEDLHRVTRLMPLLHRIIMNHLAERYRLKQRGES
jgi:hypothetical protein